MPFTAAQPVELLARIQVIECPGDEKPDGLRLGEGRSKATLHAFFDECASSLPIRRSEMKIRKLICLIGLLSTWSCQSTRETLSPTGALAVPLIPIPTSVEIFEGQLTIDTETFITASPDLEETASLLKKYLLEDYGLELSLYVESPESGGKPEVRLMLDPDLRKLGKEGYNLLVDQDRVKISAPTPRGVFYGVQTLRQLFAHSDSSPGGGSGKLTVPHLSIRDFPRFSWRGLMLDCSRTFQSLEYLYKTVDRMSYYKLNVLHLHLTDDQGWRLEIRKYPKLTAEGARFADRYNEPEANQGFYTQQEMRDLVNYAALRGITIVPEIEMPGHSLAALSCYPHLSCTGGPFEIFPFFHGPNKPDDLYCAGNEETFTFLEGVLDEVMDIFPSEYIHIGGDEAPKSKWKACSKCQQRIRDEGLTDEEALQAWFVERIGKYLEKKGRKLIGWDEVLEGGIGPDTAVMSWRGIEGGLKGARGGHSVVMSPYTHTYLDFTPLQTPIRKMYLYEPVPEALDRNQTEMILGIQGNHWSHLDRRPDRVDTMIYPRLLAIAERGWVPKDRRDWTDFEARLAAHKRDLDAFGITRWEPPAGEWSAEELNSGPVAREFDITGKIDRPGCFEVFFRPKAWSGVKTQVNGVELLAGGQIVSSDNHRGIIGWDWSEPDYLLNLPEYTAGTTYVLRVRLEGTERKEGAGEIYFRRCTN